MRKRHHDEIDRLTKEVMALVEDMKPNASQWLKVHNKLRRIRLEAMGISTPEKNTPGDITPTKAENATQKDMILDYLKLGQSLTPMEALKYFGCFRLASRISDLRRKGYAIDRTMVEDKKTGKRYASYSLSTINNN